MDYIIYLLLMLVLPIMAQIGVTSTFKKYSKVASSRGLTAEQVARQILDSNGLYHVQIKHVRGNLSDHYSPKENVVRLSDSVYGSSSIAAIGVAAHECGHACQHAEEYAPVVIRTKIVPAVNFCSQFWHIVFMIGLTMTDTLFVTYIGIAMFMAVVIFQIVTLPTELNASYRALNTLEEQHILDIDEIPKARKVLIAAAMTYVTALVTSILHLLTLLARARNRR